MSVLYQMPIERIVDNPFQTRLEYDEESIDELADDIYRNGLLQPPAGRLLKEIDGEFEILDTIDADTISDWLLWDGTVLQLAVGHRRLRALTHLGEKTVPIIVRYFSDTNMALNAWAENAQRKDITPMEEAHALRVMAREFSWTQQEIADEVGLSRGAVANKMRLLNLSQNGQEALQAGLISERHGRTLLRLAPAGADLVDNYLNWMIENEVPVSTAEGSINDYIHSCTPLLTETITFDGKHGQPAYELDPSFPLTWEPLEDDIVDKAMDGAGLDEERKGQILKEIKGACEGCELAIRFNVPGEEFDRCMETRHPGCNGSKRSLYRMIEKYRTRRDFTEATGIEVVERASTFGSYWAPEELITRGYCDREKCDCMVAVTGPLGIKSYVMVNEAVSPSIYWGCTDDKCLKGKKELLEQELAEERAEQLAQDLESDDAITQAKAEEKKAELDATMARANAEAEAEKRLADLFDEIGLEGMMTNPYFVELVAQRLSLGYNLPASNTHVLGQRIFHHLANWRCFGIENGGPYMIWKPTKLNNFIKRIEAADVARIATAKEAKADESND